MITFNKPLLAALALVVLGLAGGAVHGQENLRATLFADTEDALKGANEARASVLAPKSYEEGVKYYRSAEDKLSRGRSIDSIKKDLVQASAALRLAAKSTELAGITLTSAIQAQNDAETANAEQFAPEYWRDAEVKFAGAARRLEDGNINAARSRASDAEQIYRSAELAAIKANYLDETRRLLVQAKDDHVERYAPRTLAKAEALLTQAETALTQNRYDTDEPRSIARQAKYEVKHAMYLANTLKPVRDRDMTLEDFALSTEVPVERIASALDLVAEFDQGYDVPVAAVSTKIEALQKDSYELGERRAQIIDLETEIQELDSKLGTQSDRLVAQEEQRQKVLQIESIFDAGEAEVFTQGRNILIRPIGLVFPTGSAQIETQYFALLRKIQDAIQVFSDSQVIVEGHTDAFGGDEANLTLSRERAQAVRSYLLANMPEFPAADIEAIGYGESKPVANNETVDGRARNRRIDLVLRPKQVPTDG
jgi:outer membrane protein OmpA-like peptidoglycan-associated protein